MAKKIKRTVTPAELKEQLREAEDRYRQAFKSDATESVESAYRTLQCARNRYYSSVDEGDPEDLKQKISDAESYYKSTFKGESCSVIMDAYYELQRAKRSYYCAIGIYKPTGENIMDELVNLDKSQDSKTSDLLV